MSFRILAMKKKTLKIIFLGPPGSGKGTHSKILSNYFKIPIISAGELLRKETKRKTPKGRKIQQIINAGKLVPDSVISALIKQKVSKLKNGAIIEGYPRDLKAWKSLRKYFVPDIVIFLNISKKESLKRLSSRQICEKCNITYSIYNKPKKRGFCDICGSRLIKRADDMPKAINSRILIFKRKTKPVIKKYKKQGLVLEVKGDNKPIKEVSRELIKKIRERILNI